MPVVLSSFTALTWAMPDDRPLTPATADDLEQTLAHALQYDGRRRFKLSGESMAKITAAHLVRCLAHLASIHVRTLCSPAPP